MKIGLVGFPGSGKTTVFNALTGLDANTGYGSAKPGTQNLGVVYVPDPRGDQLAALYSPQETTDAEITFCHIARRTANRGLDRSLAHQPTQLGACHQGLWPVCNRAGRVAWHPGSGDRRR